MDRGEIKEDFDFLKENEDVLAVLIFGSKVKNQDHSQSDTDICIVAPDTDPWSILSKIYPKINIEKKNYDIKVFEELTLRLKNSIMQNHEVIWTRDNTELQDYLFRYKKLWNDQAKNWIKA
ncbi:nucleotidyltransferase domain-containing protein [Candidatus Nanohalobium constans]|uniref:DNA polymerase subunit beta n=1 Tax=Candidatus Nanohalobium constans TaxID=2565781 RepID=A0A5Q0UHB8_9ARCH|nr:nucleotidyltransferase domain-containing protein [Candidatus Nanohalobium constans]QGA80345.1 DNA polymerase subunit beta [Candidatus Nanohalobium constans]